MKYFIAVTLIAAVASATSYLKPTALSDEMLQVQEIMAAIQSPSTDPATAEALQQMLFEALGIEAQPIAVGPAIVDFPLPDGGALTEVDATPVIVPSPVVIEQPAQPAPAVVAEASSAPLVQIILNINSANAGSVVAGIPAVTPEAVVASPEPVHVVEFAPEPVQVVEVAPESVSVIEAAPETVTVVETVVPEAVVLPAPALPGGIEANPVVTLPEIIN